MKKLIVVALMLITVHSFSQVMVKAINPVVGFAQLANYAYFVGLDSTHGYELWRTDGTDTGTTLVIDLNPGQASGLAYFTPAYHGYGATPTTIVAVNGTLYFWGTDNSSGFKLWKSDGTAVGTVPVSGVPQFPPGQGNLRVIPFGNKIIMQASDGGTWLTNGTSAGTYRLFSASGDSLLDASLFFAYGSKVYLTANAATGLWISDGTSSGTILDTFPGATRVWPMLVGNGSVYLSVYVSGDARPYQVWGLDTLTLQVTRLFSDTNYSWPIIIYDSLLIIDKFNPANGAQPIEWWASNGTNNGTHFIANIYFGSHTAVVYNHNLYIQGYDSTFSYGYLYKSDGTPSGTQPCLLYSGNIGFRTSTVAIVFDNKLIYDANSPYTSELWEAEDGQCTGRMLNPIRQETYNYGPDGFFNLNGILLFHATDSVHGTSLWKLDSTMLTQVPTGQANHFKIFPNPSSDYLEVFTDMQGQQAYVKVFNLQGQKLLDERIDGFSALIDISSFAGGIYFVQVYNEQNISIGTAKFIKQ